MPSFSNGHAAVIGIADYRHINRLPPAVLDDARGVAAALTDPQTCGYDPGQVVSLLNEQANKDAVRSALDDVARRCDADSTFVFYVSAHGGRVEDGDHRGEYLLPVDTIYEDGESLARTAVLGEELTLLLNAIPARRLVAVFDCCHSAGIGHPKAPAAPEVKAGLTERYYKQLAAGQGRVVFASCRDTEFLYVRPGEANSVFTRHLLDGLRGGLPGPGGVVRVFDLFHYLQPKVVADQPNQHPVFKCEVEDNFPLALHAGGKGTPLPTSADAPADGFKYDVFLSYRQQEPDKTWARDVLLPRLKAAGLRVCVDFECFRLGAHLIIEMERRSGDQPVHAGGAVPGVPEQQLHRVGERPGRSLGAGAGPAAATGGDAGVLQAAAGDAGPALAGRAGRPGVRRERCPARAGTADRADQVAHGH